MLPVGDITSDVAASRLSDVANLTMTAVIFNDDDGDDHFYKLVTF